MPGRINNFGPQGRKIVKRMPDDAERLKSADLARRAQGKPTSLIGGNSAAQQAAQPSSNYWNVLELQRAVGNRSVAHNLGGQGAHSFNESPASLPIQARLAVNPPNDKYEREADEVAAQVVERLTEGAGVSQKPSASFPVVRRQPTGPRTEMAPGSEAAIRSKQGGGMPLNEELRASMEDSFGADFGAVRVHTDSESDKLNRSLHARAFTAGRDIFFKLGEYKPESESGRKLIAHELTHVMQQNGAAPGAGGAGLELQETRQPVVQRFLGKVWKGIKSAAGAVWKGAKSVGSTIGSGVKAAVEFGWKAVKAVGKWGWNVLKSAGAWVWDLATELPTRVWRLLKHLGSGIVGIVTWLWDGLKGASGHFWSAIAGVLKWAGKGVEGLFSWIWEGVKGGARWAWRLLNGDFSGFWEGIGDFFSWLGEGVVGLAKWSWEGLTGAAVWAWRGIKGIGLWLWRGLISGAAWAGRLLPKLLDLVGFGEIMDLLWQILKFNTRALTSTEISEARKALGSSISYWQVRIDESSLIAHIGAFLKGQKNMAVTTFHTINFTRKISTSAGSPDMGWLVHELVHVWQMEHVGMQYIGEALHAQNAGGYVYGTSRDWQDEGNRTALANASAAGKTLSSFNREQQAEIAKHYYMRLANKSKGGVTEWQPFIDELKSA